MKRWILAGALLLLATWGLQAQKYCIGIDAAIPEEAAKVLSQRFTQMLEAGGLQLADIPEGMPLEVSARVKDRMETPGSIRQVALQLEIVATTRNGEVEEVFPVKGVGENEADAWLRAVKQLLPRSKAAQAFVEKLK